VVQSPLPPKIYQGTHERDAHGGRGHLMSDHKGVNRQLAEYLFRDWLERRACKTLDVGSNTPYRACLREPGAKLSVWTTSKSSRVLARWACRC
jgi:hypothetical protein